MLRIRTGSSSAPGYPRLVRPCRWPVSAALLAIAGLLTACASGQNTVEPVATADPVAVVDPIVALEQFDASDAGSWSRARLNSAVVFEPAATRQAALERLDSDDPDVRIAAVYALSMTLAPEDADSLAPLLGSGSPAERVLAGAGMLASGDSRAVPVLIEALGIDDPLPFGAPPLRVWEQARWALLPFTGQDFGLAEAATSEEASATASAWEEWWAETESSFQVTRAPGLFGP